MENTIASLIDPAFPLVSNLSNAAAVLGTMPNINWAGFYLVDEAHDRLYLGPFWGEPACILIPLGKGVCGTAAALGKTVIVPNVDEFQGHIACSAASRSEIVVPILVEDKVVAVIDVDAPVLDRFHSDDKALLERIAAIIAEVWR